MSTKSLSLAAFLTLLLIALMMGGNHVAARLAFNAGVDVATAVTFRSVTTALVVLVLVINLLGDWLRDVFNPKKIGRAHV